MAATRRWNGNDTTAERRRHSGDVEIHRDARSLKTKDIDDQKKNYVKNCWIKCRKWKPLWWMEMGLKQLYGLCLLLFLSFFCYFDLTGFQKAYGYKLLVCW